MSSNKTPEHITTLENNLKKYEQFLDFTKTPGYLECFASVIDNWQKEGNRILNDLAASPADLKKAQIQIRCAGQLADRLSYAHQRIEKIKGLLVKAREDK